MQTDEELLSEFAKGRSAALGELARRYEQALLGLAFGWLGGRRELAEDAVQETWVRVIRFSSGFDQRSRFKTWVYRIAINQCRNILSTRSLKIEASGETTAQVEARESSSSPTDRAMEKERDIAVQNEVGRLNHEHRDILLLCYHKGLTHEEAAEVLSIPIGTLKSRLSAAITTLRERLRKEIVDDDRKPG